MLRILILNFLLAVFQPAFSQNDTTVFTIIMAGNPKGFSKEWKNADGSYGSWYQFNDRGRGDSTVTQWREDAEGFPTWISTRGKDYMKNSVEEDFMLASGVAKWKNKSENEKQPVAGKKFYLSLNGGGGHMTKALLANNNSIDLIPYGKLSQEKIADHIIGSKKLTFLRYVGFGMTPGYGWIDEQGNDFATVSEWSSNIRKGFESMVPKLLEIQKKEEANYFNRIALKNRTSSDNVLVRNVRLFDAEKAITLSGMDILIKKGKISAVGKSGTLSTTGIVIDGEGMTAIPGLWDMHVHMSSDLDGILHMAAGVTHVRDMGNDTLLLKRIRQINDHSIIGPTVEIRSGFIDGAGPFAAPTGALINSVEEGKKAIRDYAALGYQQIKLYSSIKPEWVKPLVDEARKYNLRVCGHIPAFMTATQAIEAGYNEITHMNMLALNFFGDTVDTRSPLRFSLPAQKTATLNPHGPEMQKFIALLKDKNIAVDPTLGVFENLFLARDGVMEERYKGIVNRFPVLMQRNIKAGGGGLPVPEGMEETYQKSFLVFKQILNKLYDNNITIVAGTDGFAGFDLHRELEIYVQAGITAPKVLQIASWNTAKYLGKEKQLGSISGGKVADIILIEGDPSKNISDIRNTRFIISGNSFYDARKLYESLAIKAN